MLNNLGSLVDEKLKFDVFKMFYDLNYNIADSKDDDFLKLFAML